MNNKLLATALIAAAGFAAAPGFAATFVDGEAAYMPHGMTTSTGSTNTTRAAVRSDYVQALRSDMLVNDGEVREAVPMAAAAGDAVSRAAVRSEAVDTARNGQPRDGEG